MHTQNLTWKRLRGIIHAVGGLAVLQSCTYFRPNHRTDQALARLRGVFESEIQSLIMRSVSAQIDSNRPPLSAGDAMFFLLSKCCSKRSHLVRRIFCEVFYHSNNLKLHLDRSPAYPKAYRSALSLWNLHRSEPLTLYQDELGARLDPTCLIQCLLQVSNVHYCAGYVSFLEQSGSR